MYVIIFGQLLNTVIWFFLKTYAMVTIHVLKKIKKRADKIVSGDIKGTAFPTILSELGWESLRARRERGHINHDCKFWVIFIVCEWILKETFDLVLMCIVNPKVHLCIKTKVKEILKLQCSYPSIVNIFISIGCPK